MNMLAKFQVDIFNSRMPAARRRVLAAEYFCRLLYMIGISTTENKRQKSPSIRIHHPKKRL